jgi:hypothetical protein
MGRVKEWMMGEEERIAGALLDRFPGTDPDDLNEIVVWLVYGEEPA